MRPRGNVRLAATCLLAAVASSPSAASPWTVERGALYVYAGAFATRSQHFFDADGDRRSFLNDGTSRVHGMDLQAAYGLSDGFMLLAAVPYLWYELRDDLVRDAGRSPGDLRIDVRWRLAERPLTTAVQAGVKLPTAATTDPAQARVGEGQRDLQLLLSAGRPFPTLGAWASVDLGYRWRQRDGDTGLKPGNERVYGIELGYEARRRLTLSARVGGYDGGAGNARTFGFQLPTPTSRRTTSWSPSLAYRLDHSWQLVLAADWPVTGQRSYAGRLLSVGLAYNRSPLSRLEGAGSFSHPQSSSCCQIQ